MEVIKAFSTNNLATEITIKGTINNPLFRSSDIASVLEMSNIRCIIQNFNETEKVVIELPSIGGNQMVSFLTEKGLYKVLFKSRKPIAEKFQDWVCEVIKEIRKTGKYQLERQLEEKDQIIHATRQLLEVKENTIQATQQLLEEKEQENSDENEQAFYNEFGYEPDEQKIETQNKTIQEIKSERTWALFYSEHKTNGILELDDDDILNDLSKLIYNF